LAALVGFIFECMEKTDGTFTYVVEQGFGIYRPSTIEILFTQKKSKIESIKIRGNTVIS
jgi:predicted PhzF superfamily epimerase YddE/YHI9